MSGLQRENGEGGISFSASWGSRTVALRAVGVFAVVLLLWLGSIGATLLAGWRMEQAVASIHLVGLQWQREVREKWGQDKLNDDTLACMMTLSADERREARGVETREGLRRWCRWWGR